MRSAATRFALAGLAASVVTSAGFGDLSAQGANTLATRCAAAAPDGLAPCAEAAVAGRALLSHVGLLAGLGAEVPGSPAALGLRLGTSPRLAFSARTGFARVGLPDHAASAPPGAEASFTIPVVHAGLTVGVFDGFSLRPTMGGFLALDLVAHTGVLILPGDAGFEKTAHSVSYGLRVGVLRETFSLPGISVSAVQRRIESFTLGSTGQGDHYQVALHPAVTSVRATVGKDLLAVGLLAGVGLDSYSGSVRVRTANAMATVEDFDESRLLGFAGASLNFLVLQMSVEGGMARGFGGVTGYTGSFDPGAATYFGSLAFRLTL